MVVIINTTTGTVLDLLESGTTLAGLGAGIVAVETATSYASIEDAQADSAALLALANAGPRILTRVQFLQRLTPAEWAAAVGSNTLEVLYFVELVRAAQEINLDDANTQAGLQVAVQAGVLTAERAGVVLG